MTGISGAAKLAGVIGWPIKHSLSPALHRYWLQSLNIDGAYVPLAVEPANLEVAVRTLPNLGFAGANVTVPHKEAVRAFIDHETETTTRIGAVNTLICNEDGTITGDNTDAFGFISHLYDAAPSWSPLLGTAVVLGAGGAARAVIDALQQAGVSQILVTNRTQEKAQALADHFGVGVHVVPWPERSDALNDAMLLVNTTTLGMTGKPSLDITLNGLASDAVVYDIVYAPLQTDLLKAAAERGLTTVDGLGMLLHQARPGFAAWFGTLPEVTGALREHVLEVLRSRG